MSNDYDLRQAIQNVSDKIATHVGSGSGEHKVVDRQNSGFMSPEQYIGLFNALGFRKNIPNGTDILTLAPGHYTGTNLLNSSKGPNDSSVLMIDILQYREYYKQYYETDASTGKIRNYNYYVNGSGQVNTLSPTGWADIERYVTLWEGNISAVNVKATFTDNTNKFQYLRVTTSTTEGSTKKTIIKNVQEPTIYDMYVSADAMSANIYAMKLFITSSYISIENLRGVDIKNSGNFVHTDIPMNLLKIEGVL